MLLNASHLAMLASSIARRFALGSAGSYEHAHCISTQLVTPAQEAWRKGGLGWWLGVEGASTYHQALKHQIDEPVILGQAPEHLSVR